MSPNVMSIVRSRWWPLTGHRSVYLVVRQQRFVVVVERQILIAQSSIEWMIKALRRMVHWKDDYESRNSRSDDDGRLHKAWKK